MRGKTNSNIIKQYTILKLRYNIFVERNLLSVSTVVFISFLVYYTDGGIRVLVGCMYLI